MSVRERIAGFGGSGAANNVGGNTAAPAWATQQRPHSVKPTVGANGGAADYSKTTSTAKQDPAVRKLKVPSAFQITEYPTDGPTRAVDAQSSAPSKKWGGARETASAANGSASGGGYSGLGPSAVGTKSRPPSARPVTTSSSSNGAFHTSIQHIFL